MIDVAHERLRVGVSQNRMRDVSAEPSGEEVLNGAARMTSDTVSTRVLAMSRTPGGEVLVLIRRLAATGLLAGVGYSMFSTASQGRCPGGITHDGSFIDRLGNPTDVAPSCIEMTLRPSPVVYLVLALIVVVAVSRATRAESEAAALRTLSWAGLTVILAAVVAVVLAQLSFISIPLEDWDGTGLPPIPDWLAVDVAVSPMQGG